MATSAHMKAMKEMADELARDAKDLNGKATDTVQGAKISWIAYPLYSMLVGFPSGYGDARDMFEKALDAVKEGVNAANSAIGAVSKAYQTDEDNGVDIVKTAGKDLK